jgi:hypothetical protein
VHTRLEIHWIFVEQYTVRAEECYVLCQLRERSGDAIMLQQLNHTLVLTSSLHIDEMGPDIPENLTARELRCSSLIGDYSQEASH